MSHVPLMGLLKVKVPATLDHVFRRAVSKKFGAAKGSISAGALAAIARYSGIEPRASILVTESLLVVDAPPELIADLLRRTTPKGRVTVTTPMSGKEVEDRIGRISVTYSSRGYVEFRRDLSDPGELVKLGAFRAESSGKEIVFEKDCLMLKLEGLGEALEVVRALSSILKVDLPLGIVKKRLEMYVWDEPRAHEVIAE